MGGSPKCNLRIGGDGERLRPQLRSAAQSSWKVTKGMKPQTEKGRRAACWNIPRERIQMDPSHNTIRWGKDFAARGNKGLKNRKMQCKCPRIKNKGLEEALGRWGQVDHILRKIRKQKKASQKRRYWEVHNSQGTGPDDRGAGLYFLLLQPWSLLRWWALRGGPALHYHNP